MSDSVDSIYDNPWWGSSDDGKPPEKSVLFPKPNEHGYSNTWAIEDFLQHNGVFTNGFRRCHSDSYMTCVDFAALDKAYNLLFEQYHPTEQDWSGIFKDWIGEIHQPPMRLVRLTIMRKLQLPLDTAKET